MPSAEREPSVDLMRLALRSQRGAAAFHNDPSLAFAPRDLASSSHDPLVFTPSFIGLLGAGGVLPYHYTERLAALDDPAVMAFMDLLSSRSVALYCAAWDVHRPVPGALAAPLCALAGMPGGSPPWTAFHAASLRRATLPAGALAAMVAEQFGIPVEVRQFRGAWDVLPTPQRWQLGRANTTLGGGMALGDRLWRRGLRFALQLGPLRHAAFVQFLPGADGTLALSRMLAALDTAPLQCELLPMLAAGEAPAPVLGGARLGFDLFLGGAREEREDLVFDLSKNSMIER